jgi:flagellar biosynthesis/type III secretory pathway M-ring protein FliF/YscJ
VRILRQLAVVARTWWNGLPLCDRRRCAAVSLLVPIAALAAYDARPRPVEPQSTLVPMASGLTVREADALRAHLESRRVPFEIRDGGQTVMVPADRRAELTVELTQYTARKTSTPPDWIITTLPGVDWTLRDAHPSPGEVNQRVSAQDTESGE